MTRRLLCAAAAVLTALHPTWAPAAPVSGQTELGFTLGPDQYRELFLAGGADLTRHLGIDGAVAIADIEDTEPAQSYTLAARLAWPPWAQLRVGYGYEPPANRLRSRAWFTQLRLSAPTPGLDSGLRTSITVAHQNRRYGLHPGDAWIDLDQQAWGVELGQTLNDQVTVWAGYWDYTYDRDPELLARRAVDTGLLPLSLHWLDAVGTLIALPDHQFRAGVDLFLGTRVRLGLTATLSEPAAREFGQRQIEWGGNGDLLIGESFGIFAGLTLISDDDGTEGFLTTSATYFFE